MHLFGELHVPVLLVTLVLILWSDSLAVAWMKGKKEVIPGRLLHRLHYGVLIGLAGMVLTGTALAYDRIDFLLQDNTFYVKMMFVAALVVNSFFIGAYSKVALSRRYADLSFPERIPLFVTGGVSVIGWVGAIACGLLL